jgi:hypothetical protein
MTVSFWSSSTTSSSVWESPNTLESVTLRMLSRCESRFCSRVSAISAMAKSVQAACGRLSALAMVSSTVPGWGTS